MVTPSPDPPGPKPDFPPGIQQFQVSADARPGTPIGRPQVSGLSSDGSAVTWNMKHRYKHGVPFDISLHSGLISLVKKVGNNHLDAYTVKVTVTSEGQSDSTRVRIRVQDDDSESDDNNKDANSDTKDDKATQVKQLREEFERKNFAFPVKENEPGVLVANLTLLEFQSRGDPKFVEYIITSDDAKDKFTITDNGLLYTKVGLDREEQDEYDITIAMGRRGVIRGKEVLQVRVKVQDDNDNSPAFEKHVYQGTIPEDATPGTKVDLDFPLKVIDPDLNDNARLQILGKGSGLFRIQDGDIVLRSIGNSTKNIMTLSERADDKKLFLRLRATDEGSHITESQLVIHILSNKEDDSDEDNEIVVRGLSIVDGQYVKMIDNGGKGDLSIKEDAPVGTKLARLVVTDQKSQQVEDGLEFVIIEEKTDNQPNLFRLPKRQTSQHGAANADKDKGHFAIDKSTGYLSLLRKLSVTDKYQLRIQVTDNLGLTAFTDIVAMVEDVNDHPPVFAKSAYEFRVSEGNYTNVGIGEILASDGDVGQNAEVRFEIVNYIQDLPITLNSKDGTLSVTGVLDREEMSEFQFEVKATDMAGGAKGSADSNDIVNEARVNVTVFILDVNDNAPTFYGYTRLRRKDPSKRQQTTDTNSIVPVYTVEVDSDLPPESLFFRVYANDSDVGLNGLVTFELLNHKDTFRIDSFTGSLWSLKKFNFDAQNLYDISIVASDSGRPGLRSMAAVIVSIKQAEPANKPETVANPYIDDGDFSEEERSQTVEARGKLFAETEIAVEIMENLRVPANVVDLKSLLTPEVRKQDQAELRFMVASPTSPMFQVNQKSGQLEILESPDREQRDTFTIKVRAYLKPPSTEREVPVFFYTLYVQDQHQIAEDEVTIHITIKDLNDNPPEFLTFENPVQASVSSHMEAGELIANMEAWDADQGINAQIKYELVHQEDKTKRLFRIHPTSGDIRLMAPLINMPGSTLTLTVEARDLNGAQNGLSAKVDLIVYVIDNGYQLKVVLDNNVESVMKDVQNITNTLSSLTGLNIKAYEVDRHKSVFDLERSGGGSRSRGGGSSSSDDATDVLIFGVDQYNNLITSDRLILGLTTQLPEAKSKLSHHRLREVRVGGHVIHPRKSQQDPPGSAPGDRDKDQDPDSLGSLEIAVLGMACAVFFGIFIGVVSIFGIKARRHAKNGGYPAPLAIPLPSYSVDPSNGSTATTTIHHPQTGATVGVLHHGDVTRASIKSASKYRTSM